MPLQLRAVPPCYAFAGDSHAAIFEGLVFTERDEQGAERYLLSKGRWQSYFRAARFFPDGRFDEAFTRTLRDLRLIGLAKERALPIFSPLPTYAESGELERFAPAKPAERVLVICCGEVDARDATYAIGANTDIELERPYEPIEALPQFQAQRILSAAHAEAFVRDRYLEPLFAGLRALRDAGYERLFLYSLPPPAIADAPHFKPARLRYKMNVLFNRLFERFCRETGVGFLDIWDAVTVDGLRAQAFDLDGVHLNVPAAEIAVNRLHVHLQNR